MDLEPRQPSPRKESPYYREQLETQYTEFDLSYANELLDEAGYDKWDEEGYRLTPEGQRIEFTITVTTRWGEEQLIAAEMLSEYWHELGILANTEGLTREDRQAKVEANQHDVVITGSKGGIYVLMEPFIYLPTSKYESFYAIPWVYWYEDNSTGEEPPEYVKLQMKLYDQITECTDSECIELLIDQILAIAEEQFYVMGVSLSTNQYMLGACPTTTN